MSEYDAAEDNEITRLKEEYRKYAHAIQTGAGYLVEKTDSGTPKQLRTGVDMSLVSNSALANLLISKGIISETDFWQALVNGVKDEVSRCEAELSDLLTVENGKPGPKVKLV